jgi:arabinogalactan endo-1,4-beta-galactosidase
MKNRTVVFLVVLAVPVLALACGTEPLPTTVAAPTLPPAPARPPELTPASTRPPAGETSLTPLVVESFDAGVEGWQSWAEQGLVSEVSWDPAGELLWATDITAGKGVALFRQWPDLAKADGLTIRLQARDESAMLVLSVEEADGSGYSVVLPLSTGEVVEYALPFEGFGLAEDKKDENGQLDPEQLVALWLIDISAIVAGPGANRVAIDEIVLWEGAVAPFDLTCGGGDGLPREDFRVGVDANFVPQGERPGHGFWVGEERVDPIEFFAANGVDAFRLRLWVGDVGESKLDYATDLAHRAQDAGMRPYLVLFLSDDWTDVNKQSAPKDWAGLSLDERVEAVRQYARETAQHFLDEGFDLDFYEIGNEIDYGICGVFAGTDHPRDPAALRGDTWPDEARLIKAAIEGVREADPDARLMLHIAITWDPAFAVEFFQAMDEFGVAYDYVGLSHYPSAFGVATADRFCETLDRLSAEVGKPIVIAETAYPAEPPTGGMFGDWQKSLPGYPLTPEGQAWWVADLLQGMQARGDVVGVYYFSPEFWFSGELWGPSALFDGDGRARPAVASFGTLR